jgi:hypothetical protein
VVEVTVSTRAMPRWASLAGLVYVVLFVIGSVLMFDGPSGDDPPAKVKAFYGDAGHRDRINVGWILAGLGLFAFVWFLGALREHVRSVDAGGFWTGLTTIGGAVYAAVAMAAIGLEMGIRTMSDDTYQHQVFPEVIHAADDAGYVMHATAGAGVSVMLIAATVALTSAGVLPRWALWVGVIIGIAALASILFFTIWLWLLWIAILSVLLFLRSRTAVPVRRT